MFVAMLLVVLPYKKVIVNSSQILFSNPIQHPNGLTIQKRK